MFLYVDGKRVARVGGLVGGCGNCLWFGSSVCVDVCVFDFACSADFTWFVLHGLVCMFCKFVSLQSFVNE